MDTVFSGQSGGRHDTEGRGGAADQHERNRTVGRHARPMSGYHGSAIVTAARTPSARAMTIAGTGSSGRWLRRFGQTQIARVTVLCIPHAGGTAAMFRRWPEMMPADVAVVALQAPGRGDRLNEPPMGDLRALVDACMEDVVPRLDSPLLVFGHSLGALVAFELARAMTSEGLPPAGLLVSGRTPPASARRNAPVSALPDDDFIAAMQARYGAIPPELLDHPDVLALVLPALRADMAMLEGYRHRRRTPIDVPITVLAARGDAIAPPAAMDGWRDETTGAFAIHAFEGGHFYFEGTPEPLLRTIAAVADRCR